MGYLKSFNIFRKRKREHLTIEDVEVALDVVRGFADDNNMSEDVVFDNDNLKEIRFESINSPYLYGISMRFYSNNLEFIFIQDIHRMTYKDPEAMELVKKMVKRIKRSLPKLKFINNSDDYLNVEIRPI